MIAVRDKTYVIAVGQRAYEMYEKTPPLRNSGQSDG